MPKIAKPLTDYVVKTLKPGRDQTGSKEISDGGCRGLLLRLTARGEKLWCLRVMVNGKRSFHPLGAYPAVSLTEARERVRVYASEARAGVSPAEMDARQRAESLTVARAHAEYIEALRPALRASTINLKESMFRDHVAPALGKRIIGTVRKADLIEVVAAVTAKGFPVQANRVYSELMALLRWCEQKDYLDGVPSARKKDMRKVAGTAQEQARRRTLTEAELTAAWIGTADMGDLSRDYIRLLMLTGQRRDEVRLMDWSEVDLAAALWTIPAVRYKTNIAQAVPLSSQAMTILRARWAEGATGPVLLGRGDGKPFNGTLNALRRLRVLVGGKGDFTLHDIRRTLRTGLARLGVDETTAELVIGHVPQGIVKVYDQHDRMDERRAALQQWADHLDRLAAPATNVIPLRA
ncbi:tyrosine-type recombinase/integrase [Magnetospirillum fulvum]|uniref:Integrase n=1 Tax=Magnetospirillum fulvum MGU-K5 TaxID=1316936 RepID=S9TLS3_MAGFU|nr:site-specific integrase [Magnetospirillum fulvum]EPY03231.1 integrase [Magnetospirillum fulvum MGU-K5]